MNNYDEIVNEYKNKISNEIKLLNQRYSNPELFKSESSKILLNYTEEAINKIKSKFNSDVEISEHELENIKQNLFSEHKKQEEIQLQQIRDKINLGA